MQTPRLVYKGACDDTAQTKRVDTQEALDCALADGWRLRRTVATVAESEALAETLEPEVPTAGKRKR